MEDCEDMEHALSIISISAPPPPLAGWLINHYCTCAASIHVFLLGCTHLLPKLCLSDVRSGFTNELFKHVVTKVPLTGELLRYVVMELPDSHMSQQPYNTTFWELRLALQSTADARVIKSLLKWGVRVKEEDVMAATKIIADSQVDLYESILACSTHREDISPTVIDLACSEALKNQKRNFVVVLIKWGASPPPECLYKIKEVLDDPVVQQYLTGEHYSLLKRTLDLELDEGDLIVEGVSVLVC